MIAKTHVVGGLLAGGILLTEASGFRVDNEALFLVSIAVGSLLPDIDHPQSVIARFIPIIGIPIGRLVSHRGFFHSLFGITVVFTLLGMALPGFKDSYTLVNGVDVWGIAVLWHGLLIGYFLHIVCDMLTVSGVKILYPFHWKIRIPLMRTGGIVEFFFRWLMLVCILLIGLKDCI